MAAGKTRIERDSLGELAVPAKALWGAQTQRAVDNFPVSGLRMPATFIEALALIKATAAEVNAKLGLLDPDVAMSIRDAALEVAEGQYPEQFPVDVFQTGSGTSSNMNANEVIARLATSRLGSRGMRVHPNDHVNLGQSSNDVIPTALHVSAVLQLQRQLLPALRHLHKIIKRKAKSLAKVTKTGRTHLMDAMPVRMDQELGGWAEQVQSAMDRIQASLPRLQNLAMGGTAVGTGVNAAPRFAEHFVRGLTRRTKVRFHEAQNHFEAQSTVDSAVEMSGQLKTLAVALMKISNDLRWMNSGPLTGLAEIELPILQPGSSIMPGKVNPVIPESVCQVAAQVIGNDAAITVAGQSGNFQLNVMLPLVAHNLLQSIQLLANASRLLADKAISGFSVNTSRLEAALAKNPILVTALNERIGYEQGAAIAKQAYAEGRPVLEVAAEQTGIAESELKELLDPKRLT